MSRLQGCQADLHWRAKGGDVNYTAPSFTIVQVSYIPPTPPPTLVHAGYQGILFNLGRPLARGATILGAQDKEYIIHRGEI